MAPARVLVVDDEKSARDFVRLGLELEGFLVEEARSGREAVELAKAATPDVIILDVALPPESGLDVLRELHSDAELAQVPVVMLTAAADEGTEWRARDLGATAFVAKPVDIEDLRAVLDRVLSGES